MKIKKSLLQNYIYSIIPFSAIMVLALIWGLRDATFGADTTTYIQIFRITNAWTTGAVESGFTTYINFIKLFTQDAQTFLLATSLLTAILFYSSGYILLNGRSIYHFVLFLAISPFFMALLTNVIRQGLALSIILFFYAISTKTKFRRLPLFAGFVLGAAIHLPTFVILLPLVFFTKIKRPLNIWLFCVALSLLAPVYSPYAAPLFSGKYESYLQSSYGYQTGVRWQFIAFSLFPLISFLFINFNDMSKDYRRLFDQYLLINGASLLFNFLPYYDRFLLSSWVLMPFLFAFCAGQIWQTGGMKEKVFKTLGLYIVVAFGFLLVSTVSS